MTDKSLPEKLWLSCANEDGEHSVWFDPDEGGTPYVRADLVEPPKVNIAGRWLPIDQADKSINVVHDLPDLKLKITNSEQYWVRDQDGRVCLATWADDGKRAYWWDFEGESPVDPVEFMPHPLDPRWAATTEGSDRG